MSRYGCCLELHSDRGSNYQSELFQEVCRLLEIHQTRTSGFRPIANGMVERLNSSLLNMISTYVNQDQRNLDRYLPLLTMNLLMFGRECIQPIELQVGCIPEKSKRANYNEYVQEIKDKQEQIFKFVRENLKKKLHLE